MQIMKKLSEASFLEVNAIIDFANERYVIGFHAL